MSQVTFKRANVFNIVSTTTPNDLSELLGFKKTDYLKKHCCIEIKTTDQHEHFAVVVCPSFAFDEIVKMNGIEFYGKELKIVAEDESDDETTQSTSQANATTHEEEEILYMQLDCRSHPDLNYPPVREMEVCDALMLAHADDPFKAVRTFRGKDVGLYSIESKDMERYLDTTLVIRGHEIKLIRIRRNQKRQYFRDPDGIKIRIFDAYGLQYRHIQNETFDEYFNSLGVEIIKQTQPESCRERRDVFNTNRYVVVKKVDDKGTTIDFGSRITISGISFKISYYGMEKYCGLCDRKHGWDCPSRKRFDYLKVLRRGKTDKCKIYSDSILRHTNQLSLSTNVD